MTGVGKSLGVVGDRSMAIASHFQIQRFAFQRFTFRALQGLGLRIDTHWPIDQGLASEPIGVGLFL